MDEISDKYKLDKKVLQRFKAGIILRNIHPSHPKYKRTELIIKQLDNEIKALKKRLNLE